MTKPAMLAATIVAFLSVCLAAASTMAAPPPVQKGGKAELFAVVQVGDEIRVVRKSEVAGLPKKIADEDKSRQKAYEDFKKNKGKGGAAGPGMGMGMGMGMGRGGEQMETTKPAKRSVKVLKNSLKTEQDAKEWKEKYEDEKLGSKPGKKKEAW